MSVYIGSLGRLVELSGTSSQSVDIADGATFETTLEGRVKAQVRAARRREWKAGLSFGTPAQLANILALAGGEYGVGPFMFVSADAPVTNLLTPEVSLCGPEADAGSTVSVAGPMTLPDGSVAGRSLFNTDTASTLYFGAIRTPVLPGQAVTGSAYVMGAGAKVRVYWFDSAGAATGATAISAATGVAGSVTRLAVTAMPPAGAVSCLVGATATTNAARPAITWTDAVFDWHPGEGCPQAVISGLSKNVVLALREPGYGRYAGISFTITEVG